ncbi:MAG TPA: hypothetical protein VE398_10325, partial [Acidobacteriota bacterium]|nr:hypothetical protein [Acidobacteriota bacterium]
MELKTTVNFGARASFSVNSSLLIATAVVLTTIGCGQQRGVEVSAQRTAVPRVVRVAQSGNADVIGDDNNALQKAADMLRPGDTLEIGAGTYQMDNSLFVPSRVTVRGVPGQTILKKSRGVESRLLEDGDYGERQVRVADPGKFKPGMGLAVMDDSSNSGWDVSITTVRA